MHRLLIRPSAQASVVKEILTGNHSKHKNLSHLTGIHDLGSTDWHQHRSKTITASEAFSFLSLHDIHQPYFDFYGNAPKPLTRSFISSKKAIDNKIQKLITKQSQPPTIAMQWGISFEPIARDYFAKHVAHSTIHVPGQLVHASYPFLTCSLDGLIENSQSILEIKCPFRHVSFEEDCISLTIPRLQYWVQTQIQLEIADLDHAFIAQCQFVKYADAQDMLRDTSRDRLIKGFIDKSGNFLSSEHYHQDLAHLSFIYLDYIVIYHVPRNPLWFKGALPHLQKAYVDLKHAAEYHNIEF